MKITGIFFLIAGLALTVFTAFSYFTREKVVEIGALEITRNQPHYLNWSPFIGIAVMVIGAFMILQARKK
jgi:NADH:ubiquinone oxidoreductase subunit 5 (subunit L)/multisubunit Na+/H+ antiporter MnhA subunit